MGPQRWGSLSRSLVISFSHHVPRKPAEHKKRRCHSADDENHWHDAIKRKETSARDALSLRDQALECSFAAQRSGSNSERNAHEEGAEDHPPWSPLGTDRHRASYRRRDDSHYGSHFCQIHLLIPESVQLLKSILLSRRRMSGRNGSAPYVVLVSILTSPRWLYRSILRVSPQSS